MCFELFESRQGKEPLLHFSHRKKDGRLLVQANAPVLSGSGSFSWDCTMKF